ncbi:MAG: radical SAM protein [Lachnospiraceae bacterium]|nr:radical SAM protein [Lachnospiraceae bacterium]
MKWKNKGHEFDAVYTNLKKRSKLYLFGAGDYGEKIYELLSLKKVVQGFIDNNTDKQKKKYCGMHVYDISQIDKEDHEIGIIICVSPYFRKAIIQQLMLEGYIYNENMFTMEVYMSVYYAYELEKLYFPSISFLPSTRCNLNCEACLNFTPYMKKFDERPWEQIKSDVDLFFKRVDYIMLFHISGGEPLLYPKIGELVEYIDNNYRDKIHLLRTVTNGTVLPKEELLEKLSKHRIEITVDDYREAVPESCGTFDKLLALLEEYHIKYEVNKVEEWIDLAPMTTHHEDWSEERLCKKFEGCHVPWQELRDGLLYSCNYASYAHVAGIVEEDKDGVFDLKEYTERQRKELMEFRMGYNKKGYVEFCKRCSGYVDMNPNKVMPAKQMERKK